MGAQRGTVTVQRGSVHRRPTWRAEPWVLHPILFHFCGVLTTPNWQSSNWGVAVATELARMFIRAYLPVVKGPQPSLLDLQGHDCSG